MAEPDKKFVEYLYKRDVAGVMDALLGTLAVEQPHDPLRSLLRGAQEMAGRKAAGAVGAVPRPYNLRDPRHEQEAEAAADLLLSIYSSEGTVGAGGLAGLLARSRLALDECPPHRLTVVVPYTAADSPRTADALRKARQLQWLYASRADCRFLLVPVDCWTPEGTVQFAKEGHTHTLRLDGGTGSASLPRSRLTTPDGVGRGGGLLYGLAWAASPEGGSADVVVTADASLCFHLGQVGLLVREVLVRGAVTAVGERFGEDAGLVKEDGGVVPGVPRSVAVRQAAAAAFARRLFGDGFRDVHDVMSPVAAFAPHILSDALLRSVCDYKHNALSETLLRASLSSPAARHCTPVHVAWLAEPLSPSVPPPTCCGAGDLQVADHLAVDPTATAADGEKRVAAAWHRALGRMVDLHLALKDPLEQTWLTAEEREWCAFLAALGLDAYSKLVEGLMEAVVSKPRLTSRDRTVAMLRLPEARSLSNGAPLARKLIAYE